MIIFLILNFFLPLSSQNLKPDVFVSTTASSLKEIYKPYVKRNPMIEPQTKGSVTLKYDIKFSTFNLRYDDLSVKAFSLQGIIKFFGSKEALLKNTINGEMYILRDGKIYDIKKVPLKNMTGEIRGKSVLIKNIEKKEEAELFLNEKE